MNSTTVSFNDLFNVDKNLKGSIFSNEESKELKNQILKNVKIIVENDKKKDSENK